MYTYNSTHHSHNQNILPKASRTNKNPWPLTSNVNIWSSMTESCLTKMFTEEKNASEATTRSSPRPRLLATNCRALSIMGLILGSHVGLWGKSTASSNRESWTPTLEETSDKQDSRGWRRNSNPHSLPSRTQQFYCGQRCYSAASVYFGTTIPTRTLAWLGCRNWI